MNSILNVSYDLLLTSSEFFKIYYYNSSNNYIILATSVGSFIFRCSLNTLADINDFLNNYASSSIEVLKEDDTIGRAALDKYTTSRYDLGDTYIYLGLAAPGSLESDPAWKISRYEFDIDGNPINEKTSVFGVIWNDRASLVYS